ncbi:hypothetical protein EV361DRAFT_962939 [Lentinula raphanica]|nr:hypothetical protein EV361DRAFT_962939 [Lentinula raphanica]
MLSFSALDQPRKIVDEIPAARQAPSETVPTSTIPPTPPTPFIPPISTPPTKPTTKKPPKKKIKSTRTVGANDDDHDPTWAFDPPAGMSLLEFGELGGVNEGWDWDTFEKDPRLELWVVRVPKGVNPKHLEHAVINLPGPSSTRSNHRTTKVGVLNRKQERYDIWNLGSSSSLSSNDDMIGGVEVGRVDNEDGAGGGGEEMRGFTCLLPKKNKSKNKNKRGEFYIAPRPIARHLLVTGQPAQPARPSTTNDPSSSSTIPTIPTQNPPRFAYPPELLKHRYVAFGSTPVTPHNDDDDGDDDKMELDDSLAEDVHEQSSKSALKTTTTDIKKESPKHLKETRKRKKVEETAMPTPTPKKQKKIKRSA